MILLFWFLILALALAWGIADFQRDQLAATPPPPAPPAVVAPPPVAALPAREAVPAASDDPKLEPHADPPAPAEEVDKSKPPDGAASSTAQ